MKRRAIPLQTLNGMIAMAHLETRWRCSCCNCVLTDISDARQHVFRHISSEIWAVSDKFPGKAEKVRNKTDIGRLLIEVDKPDVYIDGSEEKAYGPLRLLQSD